jgi:hypothetical protein
LKTALHQQAKRELDNENVLFAAKLLLLENILKQR